MELQCCGGCRIKMLDFLVQEINRPRDNLSYVTYISPKRRSKDSLKDKKTAKILYIFEKLFQNLVEGADGQNVHYSAVLYF